MEIKKVGVLGCGLMGSGIAQVAAMAGFDVTVLEVEQKFLDKGFAGIEKSLAKFAEKGTLKETPQAVRARLKGTTNMQDLAGCDIVVEAVIENIAEKKKMYTRSRRHREERRHLRDQHFFHLCDRADVGRPSAPNASSACTSSIRCR